MSLTQHHIPPFQGISNEDLDRFAAVIAAKVLMIVDKGDEVFNREQAAAFIKYTPANFDKISARVGHNPLGPKSDRRYLKSELLEFVKKS